jgi:hypothetical protein
LQLYNVVDDVGEVQECSATHPDVVQKLLKLADQARVELGDEKRQGSGQRPSGWVETPQRLLNE